MRDLLRSVRFWRLVGVGVVAVTLLVVVGFYVAGAQVSSAPQQPIAFNHAAMVQAGIQCMFCHVNADRSPAAGIPSVERCYGCHRTISTQLPVIQQVLGYWQRQQPIPWARVNTVPRFVYFTHEVHVSVAGLQCENCHGDVGHMTVDVPVTRFNMGFCLRCHESQPNGLQLMQCATCHQ